MVACTWIFGFGALIATWFGKWGKFGLDTRIGSCSILPDSEGHSPKEFLFVVAFVIPCLAIVVCYARIFYIVRNTALKSRLTTRNNTGTHQSATSGVGGNGKSVGKTLRRECAEVPVAGKVIKRCNFSPEDSALGSSTTGPSVTTERSSSFMENGHTSPPIPNKNSSSDIKIQEIDNIIGGGNRPDTISLARSPCLLSPPSPNHLRLPHQKKILVEPSSSSGVETAPTGNDDYNNDEGGCSSRSATPTSLCSSSTMDPCGTTTSSSGPHSNCPKPSRSQKRKSRRKGKGTPSVSVNSALSHVANVFRRGSKIKGNESPQHQSTFAGSAGLSAPGKMTAKDKKLLKMILVIFASFVVCYLPITVSKTFKDSIDIHALNIAGYILIYLTTCINPIIYVVMSSEYRQAYKNLLMCRGYTPEVVYQPENGFGVTGRTASQRA